MNTNSQSRKEPDSIWRKLRAIARMSGVILALIYYLTGYVIRIMIRGNSSELARRYRTLYTTRSMRILGVDFMVKGTIPTQVCLYVSNHRSMLDPFIELNRLDAHIVSKAEVSKYPLVGYGARLSGVIYVERDQTDSRVAARDAIRKVLQAGESVLVYPEGTTSNLDGTLEYRKGAFYIAAEENIPIIPVAIAYGNHSDSWAEGSLLGFFIHKFGKKRTYAAMSIGTPIICRTGEVDRVVEDVRAWTVSEIRNLGGIIRARKSERN